MKRTKKTVLFALMIMVVGILMTGFTASAASAKKTVVKKGYAKVKASAKEKKKGYDYRYYYYNKKGKPVKNKWVTVKGKKMYFGKDGKAYQAPFNLDDDGKKTHLGNVVVKSVDGKKYGFSTDGTVVTDDYAVRVKGWVTTLMAFDQNGVYDQEKTKVFRTAYRNGKNGDLTLFLQILPKPKNVKKATLCGTNAEIWTYHNMLQVQVELDDNNQYKKILDVSAAQKF